MLDALLVGDAEKPRGKARIVAQRADMADGGGKRLLHDIERGGGITEQFDDIGVKR